MNPAPLLRRALVGAAALAVLAAAAVAQAPKVQLGLAADSGFGSNTGAVHRIDLNTGKYLGAFGVGSLLSPVAVAVQPGTGIAFVADSVAIKRFDVSTGRFLGTVARATNFGALGIGAIRFSPSGALYVVGKAPGPFNGDYYQGTPYRIDPATGAVLATGRYEDCYNGTLVGLGVRPSGEVEMFDRGRYDSFSDRYDAMTLAYHDYTAVSGTDQADFRASSDAFLRIQGNVNGGVGLFGVGDFVIGSSGFTSANFAEGALNQSYLLDTFASTVQLVTFDTSGSPYSSGYRSLPAFAHGTLTGFAVYLK